MPGREPQTRDFGSSPSTRAPIKNVAVIGSGLMGTGIAQVTILASIKLQTSSQLSYLPAS